MTRRQNREMCSMSLTKATESEKMLLSTAVLSRARPVGRDTRLKTRRDTWTCAGENDIKKECKLTLNWPTDLGPANRVSHIDKCGLASGHRSRCDSYEGPAVHCQQEDWDHAAEKREGHAHPGHADLGADESFESRKLFGFCTAEVNLPSGDLVSPRSDPTHKTTCRKRMQRDHEL